MSQEKSEMRMIDWSPYLIGKAHRPRPLQTAAGLGDRLRFIAFAERQAGVAFSEACERFQDAPKELVQAWKWVAHEELKHESWLLKRLNEIGEAVESVPVTLDLYLSFQECHSALDFARYMANAEKRGQVAGERFAEVLKSRDPISAKMFAQIAHEEKAHIALTQRFFSDF